MRQGHSAPSQLCICSLIDENPLKFSFSIFCSVAQDQSARANVERRNAEQQQDAGDHPRWLAVDARERRDVLGLRSSAHFRRHGSFGEIFLKFLFQLSDVWILGRLGEEENLPDPLVVVSRRPASTSDDLPRLRPNESHHRGASRAVPPVHEGERRWARALRAVLEAQSLLGRKLHRAKWLRQAQRGDVKLRWPYERQPLVLLGFAALGVRSRHRSHSWDVHGCGVGRK